MTQAAHDGRAGRGGGHLPRTEQFAGGGIQPLAFELIGVVGVHLEVELGYAELAHVVGGGQEEAAGLQLADHFVGDSLAGFIVIGNGGKSLGLPHPVLGNLAGQLHKVPCHAGSCVGGQLSVAEHAVHHVAEFVEEHHGVLVAEQGRLVARGGSHVAHQHCQMRLVRLAVLAGLATAQRHDPGALALHLAGEEVHVEGAEVVACAIIRYGKHLHLRVPHFHLHGRGLVTRLEVLNGQLGEGYTVKLGEDEEHAIHQTIAFQIGAKALAVEVIHLLSQFAQVERLVPGIDLSGHAAGAAGDELEDLGAFLCKGRTHLVHHVIHKLHGIGATADHAALCGQVGIGVAAQQGSQFAAQLHHACHDGFIIILAAGNAAETFPAGLAGGFHFAVAENFAIAGGLQRDAPCGRSIIAVHIGAGVCLCLVHPVGAHAFQLGRVGDDELPGIGGILHIFAELQLQHGKLVLNFLLAGLLLGAQVGALVAEAIDNLLHKTLLGGSKFLYPGLGGSRAQYLPELFVGQHLGAQGIPCRHQLLLHLAELIVIGHRLQVVQAVLDHIQLILRVGVCQEGVLKGHVTGLQLAELLQAVAGQHHGCGGVYAGLLRGEL